MFQRGWGDWKQYRSMFGLSKCDEIDLHFGKRDRSTSYDEVMAEVTDRVQSSLAEAQRKGATIPDVRPWLVYVPHGQDNCTFTGPKFYAFEGGNLTH